MHALGREQLVEQLHACLGRESGRSRGIRRRESRLDCSCCSIALGCAELDECLGEEEQLGRESVVHVLVLPMRVLAAVLCLVLDVADWSREELHEGMMDGRLLLVLATSSK